MIDLEAALNTPMRDVAPAQVSSIIDPNAIYMNDPVAQVRLSYSTMELIRGCERKFQKVKLLENRRARDESAAMSFGKAYGAAAQLYMILRTEGQSVQVALDSAIWEIYKSYSPLLEDDKRFLERAIYCIQVAQPFHERMLMDWEIAEFNGRYAAELSFRLNINAKYYYVGYLDLVLRHRKSRRYAVTDYKSTSMRGQDLTPNYKHSDQVIGYSIILDAITGAEQAEFDTNYWVIQLPSNSKASLYEPVFHDFCFPKTLRDRMEWFLKVYLDVNYITQLADLGAYPKRGSNCTSYNRPCQFFDECQFTMLDRPAVYIPDETEYDFVYDLNTIFADHQMRLS